jgi:hypothetical protein
MKRYSNNQIKTELNLTGKELLKNILDNSNIYRYDDYTKTNIFKRKAIYYALMDTESKEKIDILGLDCECCFYCECHSYSCQLVDEHEKSCLNNKKVNLYDAYCSSCGEKLSFDHEDCYECTCCNHSEQLILSRSYDDYYNSMVYKIKREDHTNYGEIYDIDIEMDDIKYYDFYINENSLLYKISLIDNKIIDTIYDTAIVFFNDDVNNEAIDEDYGMLEDHIRTAILINELDINLLEKEMILQ